MYFTYMGTQSMGDLEIEHAALIDLDEVETQSFTFSRLRVKIASSSNFAFKE